MRSEPDFTYKTLHKLLVNNELKDFDPVSEAFKVGLNKPQWTTMRRICLECRKITVEQYYSRKI
jgi:hypothetical protein